MVAFAIKTLSSVPAAMPCIKHLRKRSIFSVQIAPRPTIHEGSIIILLKIYAELVVNNKMHCTMSSNAHHSALADMQ